jgi:hypothetical protein
MPEIDSDLFNFLALVFLGVLVIAAIATISLLGGIKKGLSSLAEQRSGTEIPPASTAPPVAGAPSRAEEERRAEEAKRAEQERRAREERDAEEARRAEEQRRAEESRRAEEERRAEEARRAREAQEAEEARRAEESRRADEELRAETPQGATAASAAEPEDQPFERDGRWWFRRGDELLVYDEQAGQWVPAPSDSPSPGQPQQTQEVPAASGGEEAARSGFWKCPNCGAVNGSTATSCRMCFAGRP